jgi:glucokinase
VRLSVDAGGTYFRYLLENNESGCVKSIGVPLESWLDEILLHYNNITIVSIGYAGQVKDGVILSAPNMTVGRRDIKSYFENKYNIKLFIQNDLECAILAEAEHFKSQNICALYLGSGMGLGVICDGKLLRGHSGVAAEIGHIPYKKSPFMCGCGKDNCIELFASGTGLLKWKEHLAMDASVSLQELRVSNNELYGQFEDALMHAIGTFITLFNPEILVLGGGIFASDTELLEAVVTRYKEFTMPISAKAVLIAKTKLHNAVLLGAFLLKDERC